MYEIRIAGGRSAWTACGFFVGIVSLLATSALAETKTLPAVGRQQAVFNLPRFGRYAIRAASEQGSAVQMVDRMAGPSAIHGRAGETNGRLDVFLEEGEVEVITQSHEMGKGRVEVSVEPFRELHRGTPPRLEELRWVEAALGDPEQRSYWLDISQRRPVEIEAFGRHLRDLRIWKEGTWLVDASPSCRERDVVPERPLTECTLFTTLEQGLYLLVAYGGEGLAWADTESSATEAPFWLRWTIPQLGEAGRMRVTMGPTGVMRWRVPGAATYFRVELAQKAPVSLRVAGVGSGSPFDTSGPQDEITKESRLPVAVVRNSSGSDKVATIIAKPGQTFILQQLKPLPRETPLWPDGTYFATTLHGGDPTDAIDPTLVVFDERDHTVRRDLSHFLTLGGDRGYKRRFNLLAAVEIFIEIETRTTWEFKTTGTAAELRIEPVLSSKPRDYRAPELVPGTLEQELDPGLYLLTIAPKDPGIVELDIQPRSWSRRALSIVGGGSVEYVTLPPNVQWEKMSLGDARRLRLWVADQGDVEVGLFVREYPLGLDETIPITLQPGAHIELPVTVPEAGLLAATTDSGSRLALAAGGRESAGDLRVSAGRQVLEIRNPHQSPVHATLSLEIDSRSPQRPLPALSDDRLQSLPVFPELTARAPAFAALDRASRKTWLVKVAKDGFYHVQSTGRLHTAGDMRTRVRIGFARGDANGVGRNFLVNDYLRRGIYQLSVETKGRSRGHLGVELVPRQPISGGQLQLGLPARRTVPAGQAVAYAFRIEEKGNYQLDSSGQHQTFSCRFDDDDGWPLTAPRVGCRQTLELDPGLYRVISLPEQTATRRITELTRAPPPLFFTGHGPHTVPLAQQVEHVWKEPEAGQPRTPDTWRFALPGPTTVTVELSTEVHGELFLLTAGKPGARAAAKLFPLKGWSGELSAGTYEIAITALRPNNNLAYTLSISPTHLVAGLTREVPVPGSVELSVGTGQLVELASRGPVDVRARLYDGTGELVATNDDRPDDWNFRITQRLESGPYRLVLDQIGQAGTTAITMQTPEEVAGDGLKPGPAVSLQLGQTVRLAALVLEEAGPVVIVATDAQENVGVAVERREGASWRTITGATGWHNRIAFRRRADGADSYRLRLWSLDQTGNPVKVSLLAPDPDAHREGSLASGIEVDADTIMTPLLVEAPPGLFEILQRPDEAMVCPRPGAACTPPLINTVGAGEDGIWWVVPPCILRARRVALEAGRTASVALAPGEIVAVDIPQDGYAALIAHSAAGQPGVAFAQPATMRRFSEKEVGIWAPSHTAVDGSAAFAVRLGDEPKRGYVWNGSKDSIIAQIDARSLSGAPSSTSWGFGTTSGKLAAGQTIRVPLPTSSHVLRLTVGAEMAVVVAGPKVGSDDPDTQVLWAGPTPQSFVIASAVSGVGGHLTLLNAGTEVRRFVAELMALGDEPTPVLTSAWQYERLASANSVARLPVGAQPEGRLDLLGSVERSFLVRHDGLILTGRQIPVGPGGSLILATGLGPVMAWIDEPSGQPRGWGEPFDSDQTMPVTVTAPMQLQLHALLHRQRFELTGPVLVHLRVPTTVVAKRQLPGAKARIDIVDPGEAIELWLPQGRGEISLRGLAGVPLAGMMEIGTTLPVEIGEGLGPEVLLSPGGVSLFSFVVPGEASDQKIDIGLGVRADADWITVELLDNGGRVLGEGLIQRASLSPGRYLMVLRLPPDLDPIHARPVLVGVERPDTGPPADVIRKYIRENEGEGGEG